MTDVASARTVATEKADPARPIRATIAVSFSGGVDDVLDELGGSADVVVEQPDAAAATPTTMAAASLNEIGARK